jgi:hypothetical protein
MRSALFWDITRRHVVIVYRRFGTTYRSHIHGSRVGILTCEHGTDTDNIRGLSKKYPTIFFSSVSNGERVGKLSVCPFYRSVTRCTLHKSKEDDSLMMAQNVSLNM